MDHERFVRAPDGTDLFVSTSGAGGPTVVLCDGLGCDGFIWRYLKPRLEADHLVVRWHYRGHGLSKIPADVSNMTVAAIREDLITVLDAVGVGQAVIVGHSMGCQVILDFAIVHPERVLAVIPVCGSYGRPLDTFHDNALLSTVFPFMAQAFSRWPSTADAVWKAAVTSELAFQYARHFEVNGAAVRRSDMGPYFQHLAGMDPRVFAHLATDANEHTVEDRLDRIGQPTLIVAGERDTFTPVWLSKRMQSLIPGAELEVVEDGTHVAPLEAPERVNERVVRFLEERVAPRA
jgi:pimeloyl-ACP methyl ester carboxylesterase